mgnify:CR=1 FL=1
MPDIEGTRGLFRGLAIPASGLSAQRRRMDVIAMNIANAQTTRAEGGEAYRRRTLALQPARSDQGPEIRNGASSGLDIRVPDVPEVGASPSVQEAFYGVAVGAASEDPSEGPLVYEPGHPDADALGYVRYPNVDLVRETIDLMEVRRAYEANATVFDAMKAMLRRAVRI